jgi:hypothetical protein
MPILAKQGEVRPLNIVDGQEFDTIYNNSTSILNNGMDRENLPDKSIPFDKFEDYAFHQYYQSYVKLEESRITEYDEVIPNTTIDGLIYNNYVGGFEYNETYAKSVQLVEGMLHLEFNCWYWFDPTAITGNASGDWVQWQIILNNNVVAETHFLYQRWGTIHLVGAVPVATGPAEIKIGFKLPSRNSGSTLDSQIFYYSGGNLLAINRYR